MLEKWLGRLGVDRLVVGHMPTRAIEFAIAHPHPIYGGAVASIDTGMSRSVGGRLSALEIDGRRLRPHYIDRGTSDIETTRVVRDACQRRRQSFDQADR